MSAFIAMDVSSKKIAADWIAYARFADVSAAPDQVKADAASMYELPNENPELAWKVIRLVVHEYSESELFAIEKTEAQRVCGLVAAGPLEDLLGLHGELFIDRIETETQIDRRMAWMLGGVCQFQMPDDLWDHVKSIADHSYWMRSSS